MDRPLRVFCFSDVYERHFKAWIEARLGEEEGDRARDELGGDGLEALRLLLARPFQLKMSLGPVIRAEDREIGYLTQQQFHLLDAISGLPRVLIHGGAGTGKTVTCCSTGPNTCRVRAGHLAGLLQPASCRAAGEPNSGNSPINRPVLSPTVHNRDRTGRPVVPRLREHQRLLRRSPSNSC